MTTSILAILCLVAGPGVSQEQAAEQATPLSSATVAGHFEFEPQLLQALKATATDDRARAAFLLGQIGNPRVADSLAKLLSDPARDVRLHAGIALCALQDARGLDAARAALVGTSLWLRYYAASALAALGTEEARAALRASLPDQAEFLAQHIVVSLAAAPRAPVEAVPVVDPQKAKAMSAEDVFMWASDVYVVLTDVYWHEGDYDSCVRCNETIVFLDPGYVEVYDNSRWLLWSMGRDNEAIEVDERAIAHNPDSWEAYFNLGFHYFNTQRYAQAKPLLKRAVELGAPALKQHSYCHVLERLGDPKAALAEWERLRKQFPDDAVVVPNIERLKAVIEGRAVPQGPAAPSGEETPGRQI